MSEMENVYHIGEFLLDDILIDIEKLETEKKDKREVVYSLRKEYGQGKITINRIMDELILVKFDMKIRKNKEIRFRVFRKYYEINYCFRGSIKIEDTLQNSLDLDADQININLIESDSKEEIVCLRDHIEGISIIVGRNFLKTYLGNERLEVWEKKQEILSADTKAHILRPVYVSNTNKCSKNLKDIFDCNLSMYCKILFYESKIIDLVGRIINTQNFNVV